MSDVFDLDALIARWRGPLVGILSTRGQSWLRAEELAQDVFTEAWLGRERFRCDPGDERAVGAWLAGIARNLHRSEARRPSLAPTDLEDAPDPVAPGEDLGAALDAQERARKVRRAIAMLPLREREVVRAFYLEETSVVCVAALLETSERAVEGLLHRARKRLGVTLAATPAGPS